MGRLEVALGRLEVGLGRLEVGLGRLGVVLGILEVALGRLGCFGLLEYQHVGIGQENHSRWGLEQPKRVK